MNGIIYLFIFFLGGGGGGGLTFNESVDKFWNILSLVKMALSITSILKS